MTLFHDNPYSALLGMLCGYPTGWLPSRVREVLGVSQQRADRYETLRTDVSSRLLLRWIARLEAAGVVVECTAAPEGWTAVLIRGGGR